MDILRDRGDTLTIHVKFHEDSDGNTVDVDWYCSEFCYRDAGHTEVGAWPCGEESDTCTMCANCESVIRHGITECWHCSECGKFRSTDATHNPSENYWRMPCVECAYPRAASEVHWVAAIR